MRNRTGRFGRANRILSSREFREAGRSSRRAATESFVLLAGQARSEKLVAGFLDCRLGVTVSKKVGNAVVRNSVKRRIREWFRGSRAEFCAPMDLVVIARHRAQGLSTAETFNALDELALKLGVRR